MKRILCSLLAVLLFSLLAGCAPTQAAQISRTPAEIAAAIEESQTELPAFNRLSPKDDDFAVWLSDYYGILPEQAADGVICYSDGAEASEIVVLLLADEADVPAAEKTLLEYRQNRAGSFDGYAPQQAALVRNGVVAASGRYVSLMICPQPSAARAAFLDCFRGDPGQAGSGTGSASPSGSSASAAGTDAVPESEAVYHPDAIVQAWRSGEDGALSEFDRSILCAAADVIRQEIREGMNDYEKELAIHDWITGWSSFDMSIFSRASSRTGGNTPYGVLLFRSGNCWGYASTFQLFMDLLDIECITVYGLPDGSGTEHAWNMVRLDGQWYCVDTAWDDPIGGRPGHTYFNVTSDFLRRGSIHRWDDTAVPEATGTAYAYGGR